MAYVWSRPEAVLYAELPKHEVIRAWVPGCATGKEAYSLAMLLVEASEAVGRRNGRIATGSKWLL
jgi:chemotaxis methyl-accepting protein methylase